jgi:hypothetical protein
MPMRQCQAPVSRARVLRRPGTFMPIPDEEASGKLWRSVPRNRFQVLLPPLRRQRCRYGGQFNGNPAGTGENAIPENSV